MPSAGVSGAQRARYVNVTTSRGRRATGIEIVAAVVAFVLFLALGVFVSGSHPGSLDVAVGNAVFGQARPLAIALTEGGLFPVYAAFSIATIAVGIARRELLPRAIVAVVALIIAWQISDVFKVVFHRARPVHWLWIHETSASYPSGHAVNVMTFWGVWFGALMVSRPSAWRTFGIVLIALWMLGVGWSRVALGAHYLSDVIGGYLLGATLALLAGIALRWLQPLSQTAVA